MAKLRVHELARELGRENKEVIEFLKAQGVDIKSHMSSVDEKFCDLAKKDSRIRERGRKRKWKIRIPKKTREQKTQLLRKRKILSVYFMHRMPAMEEEVREEKNVSRKNARHRAQK